MPDSSPFPLLPLHSLNMLNMTNNSSMSPNQPQPTTTNNPRFMLPTSDPSPPTFSSEYWPQSSTALPTNPRASLPTIASMLSNTTTLPPPSTPLDLTLTPQHHQQPLPSQAINLQNIQTQQQKGISPVQAYTLNPKHESSMFPPANPTTTTHPSPNNNNILQNHHHHHNLISDAAVVVTRFGGPDFNLEVQDGGLLPAGNTLQARGAASLDQGDMENHNVSGGHVITNTTTTGIGGGGGGGVGTPTTASSAGSSVGEVEQVVDGNMGNTSSSSSGVSGVSGGRVGKRKRKRYRCDRCSRDFAQKGSRDRHIRTVHEGERKYVCEECNFPFQQSFDLKSHINSVHKKLKPFQCDWKDSETGKVCTSAFARKAKLALHIKTVHKNIRDHSCPRCQTAFAEKSNLVKHIKHVHEDIRCYPCARCGSKFKEKGHLKKHMDSIHYSGRYERSCMGDNGPHCCALHAAAAVVSKANGDSGASASGGEGATTGTTTGATSGQETPTGDVRTAGGDAAKESANSTEGVTTEDDASATVAGAGRDNNQGAKV
eukprot:Plantae.Rhodophyta-Hildenbrandia_rubra.ctg1827.p1 GENE.Plantae.Rhodophyta-Hildenbrandia_rubra.ctg1827~~Plantae.Rhodophyta-Hildenbrandia_rubra.ctg1827.p1  ORF type:complete len:543 (-),score=81.15 Plantae.Rhodophyta-Hildenbrandia_rubra.ctg1827:1069-2697(-)